MADLRQATDTVGVPEALAAGDVNELVRLMTPIAANKWPTVASIQLRVLDSRGKEVLRVAGTRVGVSAVDVTEPNAFTAEPAVIKVLAARGGRAGRETDFPVRQSRSTSSLLGRTRAWSRDPDLRRGPCR